MEARIIFELAQQANLTASDLCQGLGLDAGYLRRVLSKLEGANLVDKTRSGADGRQRLISLTPAGQKAFSLLNQRSNEEVSELLSELNESDRARC